MKTKLKAREEEESDWSDYDSEELSNAIEDAEEIRVYVPITTDGEGVWLDIDKEQASDIVRFADKNEFDVHACCDGELLLIGGGDIEVVK